MNRRRTESAGRLPWALPLLLLEPLGPAAPALACWDGDVINYLEYDGYLYATLDDVPPGAALFTTGGARNPNDIRCQRTLLQMPCGWELAPDLGSAFADNLIQAHIWSTHCLCTVIGNSWQAYKTAVYAGLPGCNSGALVEEISSSFRVRSCDRRILIRQVITTTTTTTTTTCAAGTFRDGSACSPCPEGHHSTSNSDQCLPTLVYVLSEGLTAPSLTATGDGFAVAHVSVNLAALPAEVYEGNVMYKVDVNPLANNMTADSACDATWQRGVDQVSATFHFSDFDGACKLNATIGTTLIKRQGYLGVFLVLVDESDGSVTTCNEWILPIEVDFHIAVGALKPLQVWAPQWLGSQPPVDAGAFNSTLEIYESALFQIPKEHLIYRAGDLTFVEHALSAEMLPINPKWAWTSQSASRGDTSQMLHNLTADIALVATSPGYARFSVALRQCQGCFLHVVSSISLTNHDGSGRRLAAGHFAYGVVGIIVDKSEQETPDELVQLVVAPVAAVLGSLAISAFCGCVTRLLLRRSNPTRKASFFATELLDVGLDVLTLVLCAAEGDLELDDGGIIKATLAASVTFSCSLFILECLLAWRKPNLIERFLKELFCLHIMGEDILQLCLYTVVAASQAYAANDIKTGIAVGMSQILLLIVAKFVAMADALPRSRARR